MIWQRYFVRELVKVFVLVIGASYFVYMLIDYSTQAKAFSALTFVQITSYYLFQLSKQAELLVPFALAIALIKVLSALNTRNELVALLSAGLSLKRLIRPFLLVAFVCSALLYCNFQFLQPYLYKSFDQFEKKVLKLGSHDIEVGAIPLADGSKLLYHHVEAKTLVDTYWVRSLDHIYHIKRLSFEEGGLPLGKGVSILKRDERGRISKAAYSDEKLLPDLLLSTETLGHAIRPPKAQSILELARHLPWKETHLATSKMSDHDAATATVALYKLTIPLLSILVVLGAAPLCVRFGRSLPIYLIYCISLAALLVFFTLFNAGVILAKNQVVAPLWALLTPLLIVTPFIGWRYERL